MKPLNCRLGRHTWVTLIDYGEEYSACSACGKDRDGYDPATPMSGNDQMWNREPHPKHDHLRPPKDRR